jgi:hypothetical protein
VNIADHAPLGPGTLDALVASGSLAVRAADRLGLALRHRPATCILVAGGTASGRTTVAGCLAAAAGMHRPVISVCRDRDLYVHRRSRYELRLATPEADGLPLLIARCRDAEDRNGHPPVLVVDDDRAATEWALRAPDAAGLTRIVSVHAGSASGALARLADADLTDLDHLAAGPLDESTLAAAVQFVIYCDRDSARRPRQTVYAVDGVADGRFQLTRLV